MNLLKSLCVRFTGIRWHKMKQKEFLWYRSVPLLKINVCSLLTISIYIYVKSRSPRVEAVALRRHVSTGAQNLDLFDYFDFTLTQQIIYIVDIINTISIYFQLAFLLEEATKIERHR